MLPKSVIRLAPTLALISVLGMSNVAFANDQAKLTLAKKVVNTGKVSPYATSSFKKILQQARAIDSQMARTAEYEDMGCEFYEHLYLTHGGDVTIRNWKASVTKSGAVRATFNGADGVGLASSHLVEFDMVCKGNSCQISDVRSGYSDNPKVFPKRTQYSLKSDAQAMINANSCVE